MVKEQLSDKLELVDHLENHQNGIAEQHMNQIAEMQAVNDLLTVKIADLETQTRDRTQELDDTV